MIVVSDTSPLSSLAVISQLSLLQKIYGRIIIPSAVANELADEGNEDERVPAVLELQWIEIQQVQNLTLVTTLQSEHNLDQGEAESIVLALELNAELLIDERLGRREAKQLGLSITGLLGILLIAKARGLISAVKPLMDELLIQAGFRVSDQLYNQILQTAHEPDVQA